MSGIFFRSGGLGILALLLVMLISCEEAPKIKERRYQRPGIGFLYPPDWWASEVEDETIKGVRRRVFSVEAINGIARLIEYRPRVSKTLEDYMEAFYEAERENKGLKVRRIAMDPAAVNIAGHRTQGFRERAMLAMGEYQVEYFRFFFMQEYEAATLFVVIHSPAAEWAEMEEGYNKVLSTLVIR